MGNVTRIISPTTTTLILVIANNNISILTEADPDITITEVICNQNLWGSNNAFGRMVVDVLEDVVINAPDDPNYTDYVRNGNAGREVFGFGYCKPALVRNDCLDCFSEAKFELLRRCRKAMGGELTMVDCRIRYEEYPFYG